MRQNQLLISVIKQEVRMPRRAEITSEKKQWLHKKIECVAWKEKLFTWPCSCLGKNIILCSVRKFIVWLKKYWEVHLESGFCCFANYVIRRNVDCWLHELLMWGSASYFDIKRASLLEKSPTVNYFSLVWFLTANFAWSVISDAMVS